MDKKIKTFFDEYGPVVRIAPSELTFIDERAWKDIYGYGHNLQKDPNFYFQPKDLTQATDIIRANDAKHARMRRQLAHAFSEKALREQESIIAGLLPSFFAFL